MAVQAYVNVSASGPIDYNLQTTAGAHTQCCRLFVKFYRDRLLAACKAQALMPTMLDQQCIPLSALALQSQL